MARVLSGPAGQWFGGLVARWPSFLIMILPIVHVAHHIGLMAWWPDGPVAQLLNTSACGPAHQPEGLVALWPNGPVAQWPGGPLAQWPGGLMAWWPVGPMARWPNGLVAQRPNGPVTRWPDGLVVWWPSGSVAQWPRWPNGPAS